MADLAVGSSLGNFEILKLLGKGGMGEVYLARDLRLNRNIALKILPDDLAADSSRLERFNREAKAAASLNHPNICTIFEVGSDNGRSFISMEYVEGVTLQDRIARSAMEIPEVIDFAIQIADALEEARKKNLVHRDIKSTNILITERNQVKLLDFGLAKHVITDPKQIREASTESHLTESGVVLGTVAYMSPEQALGHTVDHRTDIFSFGVVLYEMITGRLPFSGSTQTEVIDAVLHKDPPPISRFNDKVPDALTRVIQKMLQKHLDDRYQSVHEVWSDLRQIRGESVPVPEISKPAHLPRKNLLITAALIAITIAAGLLFLLRKIPNSTQPVSHVSSLVALPCKVYGASDVAYLTDAVPSTLSTLLGQVEGLETKMPPSSVEVDQIKGDLNKIADAYNVNAFVVSSITAEAERLTINLQLIEPRSRRVLWSRQYEGTRESYNEMTRQAADGIRQVLRPVSATIASSGGLASTSGAELAFRQGLHYSYRYNHQRNIADFDAALKSFRRSLDLDSKLADAAAEMAWIYIFKAESDNQPDKSIAEAKRCSQNALALNDLCSRAWSALSGCAFFESNQKDSLTYALRAIKYGPKDSLAHNGLGNPLYVGGTPTMALSAYQTATSLDPLYLYPPLNVADAFYILGRYEEALAKIDEVLKLEPNMPFGMWIKGFILAELNRQEELTTLARELEKLNLEGKLPLWQWEMTQHVIAVRANQDALAGMLLNRIEQNFTSRSDFYYWYSVNHYLIPFLIHQHKIEDAIVILNRELEIDQNVPYEIFLQNPYYKTLRNEPRLHEHVSRSRGKLVAMLSLMQKAQQRGEVPKYLEKPLSDLRAQIGGL